MVDLVLARPPSLDAAERHWSDTAPLGPAYLLAAARAAGLFVAAVDGRLDLHDSVEETAAHILSKAPRVVGISALTANGWVSVADYQYQFAHSFQDEHSFSLGLRREF